MTRSPQGRPIIVQAGSSSSGQQLAARYAEVVFHDSTSTSRRLCEFYAGLKAQVVAAGRRPEHCNVMPGLVTIVGRSDEEAREHLAGLMKFVDPTNAMKTLSLRLGHDMSAYPLDAPFPELPLSNRVQSFAKVAASKAKRLGYTLRDLYNEVAIGRGYLLACGSPTTVADLMEEMV